MTDVVTPIDQYLAAQQDLRVVERFARTDVSGRTGRWSELIPLSAPGPGEQYRFDVDLDACTGCKACVTACHNLNGLDEGESFRSIGMLVAEADTSIAAPPAQQTVTTACHHCVEPGCLIGCPAEAYEKDPITGIVKHLDDACIGCQYCTLTCPYDVPVFNDRLGIVRKCDLCSDRLADGEAPACVQGCPTHAISVTTVAADELRAAPADDVMVPGAAPSALTSPTTRYRGTGGAEPARALDAETVTAQHAHLPLVAMLTLSQWAVGVAITTALLAWLDTSTTAGAITALALAATASLASFAHLGQPLKAWRVVLGWKHSWLSREAIAVGGFVGVATMSAAASVAELGIRLALAALAALLGLAAVGTSTMIYVATGRWWWRTTQTAARFGGTVVLGAVSWGVVEAAVADRTAVAIALGAAGLLAVEAKLRTERSVLASTHSDGRRTASLLTSTLRSDVVRRIQLARTGAALLLLAALAGGLLGTAVGLTLAIAGSVVLLAGELAERRLFFAACAPRTMPGAHR